MRPLLAIFVSAVFFVSIFAAFNPADYLYPGEENASITQGSITSQGIQYTLVKIDGHETFLLSGGNPVNNSTEIYNALRSSLLSGVNFDARKLAIKGGIMAFNESRNKKIRPTSRYGVEDECKLENVAVPCNTLTECIATASIICSIDPTVSCDAGQLGKGIYEFYPPSVQLDKDVSAALAAANAMTVDNAGSSIDTITAKLASAKADADKMSHSIIRYPAITVNGQLWYPADPCNQASYANGHYDECTNVIGRCYPIPFDFSSLSAAQGNATELLSSLSSFASLDATAMQIATGTADRIDFKVNGALIAQYDAKFSAAKANYSSILAQVDKLRPLVADPVFTSAVAALDAKSESIEMGIASKQFSGIDSGIAEYGKLALAANVSMQNASAIYYAALKAQDGASDALIEAEWAINTKDPGVSSDFAKLKARQASLDSAFRPPLNSSQYTGLKTNYLALAQDARSFTGNRARNLLFSISGGAGKSGADSLLALASTVTPIAYKDRASLAPIMPPILLALTSLSLVSLALVAFAAVLVAFRGIFQRRIMMVLWVGALLGFFAIVGAGSVGAYYILNQSSPGATLTEFMSEARADGSAFVLVDTAGATPAAVDSMDSCAAKIASSLHAEGIASSSYRIEGSKCYVNGKLSALSADACLNSMASEPIFHLKYSATPKNPLFTLLVSKEASISGDAAYMDKCVIEDAITNTH